MQDVASCAEWIRPGYWWQWRNHSYKSRYQEFIENLIAAIPALDVCKVPVSPSYAIHVPGTRLLRGCHGLAMRGWVRGTSLRHMQLGLLQAIPHLQKISIKIMDCVTTVSRGCHFISDIFLVGMEKEKKACHGT